MAEINQKRDHSELCEHYYKYDHEMYLRDGQYLGTCPGGKAIPEEVAWPEDWMFAR